MGLGCLLLTGDAMLLEVIRTNFSAARIGIELRTDAASAIELSARRHLDSFVIDCDGVSGAMDLLAAIRSSRSNKASVVFAVVNAKTTVSMAVEAGANFVLGKPVQDKPLRGILDIALLRMEREHRRYFRHAVDRRLLVREGRSHSKRERQICGTCTSAVRCAKLPSESYSYGGRACRRSQRRQARSL